MRTLTKKILCAAVIASVMTVKAQVATLYSFSSFQSTYTPITTGGTVFNTASFDDQDIIDPLGTGIVPDINLAQYAQGPGVNIGFNFNYNNFTFDRMGISNNGYIVLGNSADGNTAIYELLSDWNRPISASSNTQPKNQQRIAPCGTDLLGRTGSDIRVVTLGTAPTRSCVIQWSNYQTYVSAPTGSDNINFQLWLYETSNIIDFVYGTFYSPTLDTCSQVGLRGNSNADYNNRSVSPPSTWATSNPGTANNYFARYNTALFPASGLTYRWSMPQCSGALAAISATSALQGICPGKSFTVGISPAYTVSGISYTWTSSGSSSGPYTVMPNPGSQVQNSLTITAPTWYQLNALCIHSNGSITSVPFNATLAAVPSLTAVANPTNLCSGSSLTLSMMGNPTTHTWVGGYTSGVGFPASTSQNYTVIGTSVENCTAMSTVSVSVVQTPTQGISWNPFVICAGSQATLTSPGATNYTWTSGTQTLFTSSVVINPTSAGNNTWSVTKSNGVCVDTKSATITTYSLPLAFAIVSGPTLVCASTAVTLAVAGGQTYTWTSPGNPPITPSFTFTGANPVVFPPVSTVYSVAVHDGTCVNTTTVAVSTNPNPTLIATASPTSICQGEVVTVSVTGASNYTWTSTSSTSTLFTATFTDQPTIATAYNVTGDNNFGCTGSAVQIVLVNQSPTLALAIVPNKTLVCNGGNSTLTAAGADSYTWSSGTVSGSGTMAVVTSTNISSGPVVYTVSGTNTITQCSNSKTISVNVFIPTLTVTGNTITCPGGPIILSATGGSNGYNWQTPDIASSPFSTLNTTLAAGPTVFTVSANTTSIGVSCPTTKTVEVDVYQLPAITAVAQRTTICVKESVVLTAGGGTAYVWNNGQQTTTISVSPASNANYTVTGTDLNGCSNTGTVNVKVLGCTGINELGANSGLSIYPNPNSGEFIIQSSSDAKLTLVNELGQIVRTFILSGSNNYKVQVNDVAQGVYFLNGEKDGGIVNQKIIVTK